MKIRFTAGSEVLRIADVLADQEALAPLSVEGALLVFDFGAGNINDALESIAQMDAYLGGAIADIDDQSNISALTALKLAVLGVEIDVRRQFALRDYAPSSAPMNDLLASAGFEDATVIETGSHPTSTGDDAISIAPQQSSDAVTNEEIEIEQSQPEPEPQQQSRRSRRG